MCLFKISDSKLLYISLPHLPKLCDFFLICDLKLIAFPHLTWTRSPQFKQEWGKVSSLRNTWPKNKKYWSRGQSLRRPSCLITQHTFKPHLTATLTLVTLNFEMGAGAGHIGGSSFLCKQQNMRVVTEVHYLGLY